MKVTSIRKQCHLWRVISHGSDLEYCRKGERCGTRHGRLVLSITRPCSVSSAAATCAKAALFDLKPLIVASPPRCKGAVVQAL